MKRSILFAIVAICAMQFSGLSQSIGKGKNVFYIGIGGGHGYGVAGKYKGVGFTYGTTPTLHLGFEHGVSESIPQSVIGLGGHFSVWAGHQSYRDVWGNGYNRNWTDFTVMFRGLYHHKFLVGEKYDVYACLMAGLRYRTYSYSYTHADYFNDPYGSTSVAPATGVAIGGRYYLGNTFGFYAEVAQGYNVDYAQIGFAFKF
jgi:hypothetical protein